MNVALQENGNPLPEGYKMTELGPLPKEWKVVKLGEVLYEVPLKMRAIRVKPEEKYTRIATKLYGKGLILKDVVFGKTISSRVLYSLQAGDFIFSKINIRKGAYGVVEDAFAGAVVSTEHPILNADKSKLCLDYLSYFLMRPEAWEYFKIHAKGFSGKERVKVREFLSVSIPLPPLPEQRAIAGVLRAVQQAKEATERVIAAAQELKKSLMRHLFTYGPVPVDQTDQVPLQETEIGPIPKHWQVVKLGEVGRVITGKTPPTSIPSYWNGSIPFITPVDLQGNAIRTAQRSITEAGLKFAKPLPKGTVVVSCIGYIGKVGVIDNDVAVTNQQINAVIPSVIHNWFLAYALLHEVDLLKSRARVTTVPILHKSNFERIPIPLPPLSEQQEIARILRAADEKIRAEEARKEALEALFKALLHDLMTARRRLPAEVIAQFADTPPTPSVGAQHRCAPGPETKTP